MPVEVLGVVPRPVRRETLLETSNKVLQARLGAFYPALLLLQTVVFVLGCLVVFGLRVRWPHVPPALPVTQNGYR